MGMRGWNNGEGWDNGDNGEGVKQLGSGGGITVRG